MGLASIVVLIRKMVMEPFFSFAETNDYSFLLMRRGPAWPRLTRVALSQVTAAYWKDCSHLTSAPSTGWVKTRQGRQ